MPNRNNTVGMGLRTGLGDVPAGVDCTSFFGWFLHPSCDSLTGKNWLDIQLNKGANAVIYPDYPEPPMPPAVKPVDAGTSKEQVPYESEQDYAAAIDKVIKDQSDIAKQQNIDFFNSIPVYKPSPSPLDMLSGNWFVAIAVGLIGAMLVFGGGKR